MCVFVCVSGGQGRNGRVRIYASVSVLGRVDCRGHQLHGELRGAGTIPTSDNNLVPSLLEPKMTLNR